MLSDGAAIPDESVGFCLQRKGKKMNIAYNMDCMEAMRKMPDKCFDLAVVDPPYGININHNMGRRKGDKPSEYKKVTWDSNPPDKEYFDELFRVSKSAVIWGGNYYSLPPCKCFLVWRKPQISENVSFSMLEYAWTNLDDTAKEFIGMSNEPDRIHPTQKPVALYAWIYSHYAKHGYKILDTHLGSGSSRIAAYDAGIDFVGFEIDKDYFDRQEERYNAHASQMNLFLD